MKANDPRILEKLNEVLTQELTAINQYFLHAEMCNDWGYQSLYQINRGHSIGEMKHAEQVIERILFLDGVPNVQRLGSITIGESVPEQLKVDLALEMEALPVLRDGIKICLEAQDDVTRNLLEEILKSEEEHVDWLESQLELINQVGTQAYLAEQINA